MHQTLVQLCIFSLLACFQAANISVRIIRVTLNTSSTAETGRPEGQVDFDLSKPKNPSVQCPTHKSCFKRCTLNRQFHNLTDKDECFCDPLCDSVFHDCCEDYDRQCNASFMRENVPRNSLDRLWTCTNIGEGHPIWMIAKCNPSWDDKETANKCSIPNERLISTQIPVVDKDNVTFRNRYCAICNNIHEYKPWNFTIKCNAQPPSHYNEDESWLFTDYFCPREYLDRKRSVRGIRYCFDVIKTCKNDSNEKYKKNCEEGPTGLVVDLKTLKNYKNLDCYLCNSEQRFFSACGPRLSKFKWQENILPKPYSAIFTSSTNDALVSYSRCPTGQIYNARLRGCSELFQGKVKEPTHTQLLKRYAFMLHYQATREHLCSSERGNERRFRDVFEKLLKISLVELDLEVFDLNTHKQNDSRFAVTFQILGLKEYNGDYTKIENLIFHAISNKDARAGYCQYFLTEKVARKMHCDENTTFVTSNMSTLFSNGTLQVSRDHDHSYYNKGEFLRYNKTHTAVCKEFKPANCSYFHALQNATDFVLFPNRSIYSHTIKLLFDYGKYSIIDSNIWLCLSNDEVLEANRKLVGPSSSIHKTILSYMTLISLTLSILSLCAVITFYSMNRSLRNLPGKNLMLLCGTLAASNVLWLVKGTISPSSELCTGATIAIHFAFLSSFCTSGSIAIHSFLTFRRLANGKLYDTNSTRKFLMYCMYSIGLPTFWVSLCWTLQSYQVILLRNETPKECWFENFDGLKIAFLYPVAVQLFVNTCLLIATLKYIQKCSKASRQLQKKSGGLNKSHVWIYFRMSTLMGLSWLFGSFVIAFPKIVAFEYLFVFGNGLQGVYIAFAFLFTKNAKKIVAARFNKSTTRSASQSLHAGSQKPKE